MTTTAAAAGRREERTGRDHDRECPPGSSRPRSEPSRAQDGGGGTRRRPPVRSRQHLLGPGRHLAPEHHRGRTGKTGAARPRQHRVRGMGCRGPQGDRRHATNGCPSPPHQPSTGSHHLAAGLDRSGNLDHLRPGADRGRAAGPGRRHPRPRHRRSPGTRLARLPLGSLVPHLGASHCRRPATRPIPPPNGLPGPSCAKTTVNVTVR